MNENPKVFISHADEDKQRFVLRFYESLRSRGIDAWLDTFEMLPGDKLVTKVFEDGLKQSDAVIIVLSAVSIMKPFVQKELNTAVIRSVKEKTRLIPVRLDKCEIPVCLIDTIYQEISDLNNYDADLERIVNAIYGQYVKPPLGDRPQYVQDRSLGITDLSPIDSTIFARACRIALEQGHTDSIDADRLVNELKQAGISEAQIMETEDVLEGSYYIRPQRVIGPPSPYDFAITTSGFEEFAKVGIPDYNSIVLKIARFLVQHVSHTQGHYSIAVAEAVGQSIFVVEHVIKMLESYGRIQYDGVHEGDLYVYKISPELRRQLEGNS